MAGLLKKRRAKPIYPLFSSFAELETQCCNWPILPATITSDYVASRCIPHFSARTGRQEDPQETFRAKPPDGRSAETRGPETACACSNYQGSIRVAGSLWLAVAEEGAGC
jgi:hypothetical protein